MTHPLPGPLPQPMLQALDPSALDSPVDPTQRARDELRGWNASPRGRVSVGLPPRVAHVMAAPLVHRFRQRFPDAVIAVAESLSTHLREWLIAGRLDLALLFDPPRPPARIPDAVARASGPRRAGLGSRASGARAAGRIVELRSPAAERAERPAQPDRRRDARARRLA
ncbi:MAG: LysR substrate-binding domain-containing protein [Casimicrobiaceae bacterium]